MGEVFVDPNTQPSVVTPEQGQPEGSFSYRDRLRSGLGRLVERGASLVDSAAAIVVAHDDLRLARKAMHQLDEPFGGLLERQAMSDPLSAELESDIILDFHRDAQRAGFTDVDTMPTEARIETAEQVLGAYRDALAAEIVALHPEWSAEEVDETVATRAEDMTTLFSMDEARRDEYLQAQLEYHKLRDT